MRQEELLEIIKETNQHRLRLVERRNTDYTQDSDEDALANFHDTAKICRILGINITASEGATFLHVLKLVRDSAEKKKGTNPGNPKRIDHRLDGHNYIDLAYASELDEIKFKKDISSLRGSVDLDDINDIENITANKPPPSIDYDKPSDIRNYGMFDFSFLWKRFKNEI